MIKNSLVKTPFKLPFIITAIALVLVLIAFALYAFVFKDSFNSNVAVTEKNKDNAKVIEQEKDKDPIIISDETQVIEESAPTQQNQTPSPQPTYDEYGPSTTKTRPNVHTVVLAVSGIYQEFIAKLRDAPESERQAVADQYLSDRSAYFSPSFNYLSSDSLHLFPQSSIVPIPEDFLINSAIVDPSNSRQIIVQLFLKPDTNWSILLVVKMKGDGNFGTFESLTIRNNRNPL